MWSVKVKDQKAVCWTEYGSMELPDTHKLILPKLKSRIAQRIFQSDKIDTITIIYLQIADDDGGLLLLSFHKFQTIKWRIFYTMF